MYPKHDFHTHSDYSDGRTEPLRMVESATKRGLKALAITDHGPSIGVGIEEGRMMEIKREIEFLKNDAEIPVLFGIESNILDSEANLDIPPGLKEELDFVMAGIHSREFSFLNSKDFAKKYLESLLKAVKRREIDIISHPFWYREDLSDYLEIDDIKSFAKYVSKNDVAVELNEKYRVPKGRLFAAFVEAGAEFSLGSDAHSPQEVGNVGWGIKMLEKGGVPRNRLVFSRLIGD